MKYLLALVLVGCSAATSASGQETKSLRAGIIGLDTSHVVAFTRVLNNPNNAGDLAGVRVVAAFPGGSPDVASSRDRVAGYTKQLRDEFKVEIVSSIDELLSKVDVVLLESVDGRPHLTQAKPVLKSGKPIFIDKPIAGSLADALAIFDLADKYKTPVFSSSSLRYYPGIAGVKRNAKVGAVMGCLAYGPCSLEEHHPDLFWYGIHGVESLFTIMGTGCQTVSRAHSADADVVTGIWADGRIGTFRGIRRGNSGYDALVFGSKGIELAGGQGDYEPLVKEIARFLKTGMAPVSSNETIEIYTFMEAADESKRQGGKPVAMESVLQMARAINAKKRLGSVLGANTWDRFRGPNGTGTVIDKDVPVTFNSKENVVWKVNLPGYGNSSPIVWGNHLFVQSASKDGSLRTLSCLDTAGGKTLWERSVSGVPVRIRADSSSASSTPTTDGEAVYVSFWDGKNVHLAAYDFQGQKLWSNDLGLFNSQHGAGASPILFKNLVILASDMDKDDFDSKVPNARPSTVLAFNKRTGSLVWESPRAAERACYSAPFLLHRPGKSEPDLVITSTTAVTGYNPENGTILWEAKGWQNHALKSPMRTVASPALAGDVLCVCSGGDAGRFAIGLAIPGEASKQPPQRLWENRKDFPYVPSPVARGDYFYFVNDAGFAGCYHARTGKRLWFERLADGGFTASPLVNNGNVYATSAAGDVFVFAAEPTFHLLARNEIGEVTRATPAVSGGRLYIRGERHLYCIGHNQK